MEDDIDIEEHDILEHPQIKKLFPDFSQVKLEIHDNGYLFHDQPNMGDEEEDQIDNHVAPDDEEIIIPDIEHNSFTDPNIVEDTIEISDDVEDVPPTNVCEKQEFETITDDNEKETYTVPLQYQESSGYSFESEVNVKQEFEYEQYGDDLPPEDIYHFKNKIILGTKPSSNVQNSCIEPRKEFLPVSVVLEDWTEKLETLTYCRECQRLFSTQNALDAHKMTAHSLLVAVTKNVALKSTAKQNVARKSTSPKVKNQARKSTGTVSSKFCNHCSKEFPDHTALIKHLYELLPLNSLNCDKCDAVFNTQKELMDHNAIHIKKEKNKVEKSKVVPKKIQVKKVQLKTKALSLKTKVTPTKSKVVAKSKVGVSSEKNIARKKLLFEEDIKKPQNIFVIPKAILFECSTCKVNFLNSLGARIHQDTCTGAYPVPVYDCEVCKKKFRVLNAKEHKRQHEISSHMKVYKVTENTYNRVLTECPKCCIHFTETSIIVHFKQNKCGKIPKSFCSKCQIYVPTVSYVRHCLNHKKGFTRRDFIFVQNVMHKVVKRKIVASKIAKSKLATTKTSKAAPTKVVACKTAATSTETSEKPPTIYSKGKMTFYFCTHCKSVCKSKTRELHCKKLCKKFETVVCNKCGLQVRNVELKSHFSLHYYKDFDLSRLFFLNVVTQKPVKPSLPNYHQCTLCGIKFNREKEVALHKCGENYKTCKCGDKFDLDAYTHHAMYHKLNITTAPKVLFNCKTCDIVTDVYDRAVEHSQNHDKIVKNKKTIKCYICNLKFDDTTWQKHSALHSEKNVSASDFKILTYDPDELLTDEWLKLFQNLSASQTREIIKSSLYSIERSVPMKLLKSGRVEYTLYVCSQCEICFENSEITSHLKVKCMPSHGTCTTCSLKFKNANALEYHELLHKGVKNEDFRIVQFVKNKKDYVIFKCTGCYCCLSRRDSIQRHKCPKQNRNYMCRDCGQLYPKNTRIIHGRVHEANPDFVEKNIDIEYFDPTESESKVAKVYKCDCGLHFASLQSVAKHVDNCNGVYTIHAEKCSKCHLLFPTDMLVSHLCKHHSNHTKIVIEEYRKVQSSTESVGKQKPLNDFDYKLYKCGVCDQYFVSQSTCYNHVLSSPHKSLESLHECHICGLHFTGKSLYIHKRRHHEKYFNLNRVLVEEYHPATEDRPIKIDMFMATDKLQSLLVSSST